MQYYVNLSSANKLAQFSRQRKQQVAPSESMTTAEEGPREAGPQASPSPEQEQRQDQQQQQQQKAPAIVVTASGKSVKFDPRGSGAKQPGEPNGPKGCSPIAEEAHEAAARPVEAHEEQERPFDVIIFAASSSVGRFLVEELALVVEKQHPGSNSSEEPAGSNQFSQQQQQLLRRRSVPTSSRSGAPVRWAVAGRSAVRMSETLCQAELSTGIRNLSHSIPVILADLNHHRSLLSMCQKTRLVINCAGPYSELGGEVLIQACIESGSHYVDLAHETTFVESMARLYSERARAANVLVLNGCGFQSMSAECGVNFMKQVADGRIEQVKIILSLSDTSAHLRLGSSRLSSSSAAAAQSVGIVTRGMWNSLLVEKSQEVSLEERMRRQAPDLLGSAAIQSASGDEHEQGLEEGPESQLRKRLLGGSETTNGQTNGDGNDGGPPSGAPRPLRGLERKDTKSLVKDIVQFRNRANGGVSLAWPLQLIQGFQIQKGRGYCWPIDTLTSDESQLIRSEMNNYELRQPDVDSSEGWRPIRTSSFFSVKNFTHLCMLFLWSLIFQLFVKFSLSRYLMRHLAQLASLGHVTSASTSLPRALLSAVLGNHSSLAPTSGPPQTLGRDALSHIKYCQTFIAYGQPSDTSGDPLEERERHTARRQVQLLVSRVVGPEPNHVATATFAIQAALTILSERDHLPVSGGVLTPGAAFAETNIIYQLRRRNIKFEVLKKA